MLAKLVAQCNLIWPAGAIKETIKNLWCHQRDYKEPLVPAVCSACLLPNSENIEGRRARERNHREKTICKQMIARIFVQEAVCSDRMIYFSCIPRRMKCLLDQSQHLFLSFSLLCSLTMCTFPFKKERKKSTVKYGWCMLYCVVHREASST